MVRSLDHFVKVAYFLFERCFYIIFYYCCKVYQFPNVFRERNPIWISEEECRPATGGVYAIVVKYVRSGFEQDFFDLLEALGNAAVNIVVVCNGRPPEEKMHLLRKYAVKILVRPNIGRDFAAYRAATLHLNTQKLQAERVIYANDSLCYIAGEELNRLIRQLAETNHDALGAFENYEFQRHIGSFLFSVSGDVFTNRDMLRFWRTYRPYSLRLHAIRCGELKMNMCLRKQGFQISAFYNLSTLSEKLQKLDFRQVLELIPCMDNTFRRSLLRDRLAAFTIWKEAILKYPRGVRQIVKDKRLADEETVRELSRQNLIDAMIERIVGVSQVHVGFGLFHRLLDAPLVKKDLIFRGLYQVKDLGLIMNDVPESKRLEIMRIICARSVPSKIELWKGFLRRHGHE